MSNFRQPLRVDERGLYITEAQMMFFLNTQEDKREEVPVLELLKTPEFLEYYENCVLYNVIWDMLEEDPTCGEMVWDHEIEEVSFQFPQGGKVYEKIMNTDVFGLWIDEEEEDNDPWGLGLDL